MSITKEEAIRRLGRYDSEYYTPATQEAHRMGIAALNRVEELEKELADERHRHDRYVDFELAEAEELEFQKNATIQLREQWQAAERLICTMCGHCEHESQDGILVMQKDCGEIVGYPCCGKFIPRNRWIPVTEPPKESGDYLARCHHHRNGDWCEVVPFDADKGYFVDLGKHYYPYVTGWMPLPDASEGVAE